MSDSSALWQRVALLPLGFLVAAACWPMITWLDDARDVQPTDFAISATAVSVIFALWLAVRR